MIVELPYWFQTGFTARQGSCGKVILSVVSVCLEGAFVTITYDALDFTVQASP